MSIFVITATAVSIATGQPVDGLPKYTYKDAYQDFATCEQFREDPSFTAMLEGLKNQIKRDMENVLVPEFKLNTECKEISDK